MRQRVDAQFGVGPMAPSPGVPNLIQQFAYGISTSELLQVKEKTPFPTVGDVVQPVLIVDDLRTAGRQPMRRWFFGVQAAAAVGQPGVVAVSNEGVNTKGDRIVIDLVRVRAVTAVQFFFYGIIEISQLAFLLGAASRRPALAAPLPPLDAGTNLPQVGTFANVFTDRTAAGQLGREITGPVPINGTVEIPGPFILPPAPNGVNASVFCVQSTVGAAGESFTCEMFGHEYPG